MIEILCVVDLHAVGWGEIPRALVTPIKKPLQFLKRSLFKNSAFMEQIATTLQEMMLYSQVDFSLSQKWSLSLSFSSLLRRQCDHIGRFLGTWLNWCKFRAREISRRREKWKIQDCQTRKIAIVLKNFPNLRSEKAKRKMHWNQNLTRFWLIFRFVFSQIIFFKALQRV